MQMFFQPLHCAISIYLQNKSFLAYHSEVKPGCICVSFLLVEPLPRNLSDWQKGPVVEESVKDAGSLWQTRVQLFPSDLRPAPGHQAAAQGLGRQWLQAEMDHQTCMLIILLLYLLKCQKTS